MNISDKGLAFIKNFEAYMRKLPDGGCTAYREVLGHKNGKPILDIPTIGYGCTEGVAMGDVWSADEAEAAFRKEIAKHAAIVNRLVTVDLTQGQFDALCSFNYNCGKLGTSTLLKKLNAGDAEGAAEEFANYTLAGGVRLKGLVRRRAGEKALFLSDTPERDPEHCPQQADDPKADHTGKFIAAATAPATSKTCMVDPRKSSIVRYRPQKRSTVAGAVQYKTEIARPASRDASGGRKSFSHLKCARAGHRANHGMRESNFFPSGKIAGNCAIPSQSRCTYRWKQRYKLRITTGPKR